MRHSVIIIAVILGCLTHSETGLAQSIDKCMSASVSNALQICKGILDSGSRNANVYWKLSSALYQDGQQAQADKTLDAALRLHPGNSKLLALKEIISSDVSEKERIEESAKINQRSLNMGALKISCLSKSGEEAISACKRRLELTNDDGERMSVRLAKLESEMAEAAIATAPIPPVENQTPLPAQAPASTPTEQAQPNVETAESESTVSDLERQAAETYKTLVANVQRQLNELGFNTGLPDGVPGKVTLSALSEFYNAVDAPVNTSISSLTLEDLNDERRNLEKAMRLVDESYRALEQGTTRLAKQRLNDARLASNLVTVPAGLERAIRSLPVDIPSLESALETTTESFPNLESEKPTVPTPRSNSNSQQFGELMRQIKSLHEQITLQQKKQALELERLRSKF